MPPHEQLKLARQTLRLRQMTLENARRSAGRTANSYSIPDEDALRWASVRHLLRE